MPNDKSKKSSKKTNNQPIMKKKKNSDSDNDEPVGEVEEVEMDMDEFRKELHKKVKMESKRKCHALDYDIDKGSNFQTVYEKKYGGDQELTDEIISNPKLLTLKLEKCGKRRRYSIWWNPGANTLEWAYVVITMNYT